MKQARDAPLAQLDTGDIADCMEEGRPTWIQSNIWERLIREQQATNRFQELSEKNKNQMTKKNGDASGSVSLEIHEKCLI